MKLRIIYIIALFLLMLNTGVFWGTWFTLTRSLEDFSSEEFMHIGKVIIENVAVPMRIILPSGILFLIISLVSSRNRSSLSFYTGIFSLVFLLAALVITLTVLVPIDNDIKSWTSGTIPDSWEEIRNKWKTFHAWRTYFSLASFALFSIFVTKN